MLDATLLSVICLGSFLFSTGLLLAGFQSTPIAGFATKAGHRIFILGTLALTYMVVAHYSNQAEPSDRTADITSMAFAVVLAWVSVLASLKWRMQLVGALTAPIIALTLLLDAFFGGHASLDQGVTPGPLLTVHVFSAIVGQVFAVAACGASLLLLWQQRKLKNRQLNFLPQKFPALDTLGDVLSKSLWIGFTFITTSLLTGAVYSMMGYPMPGISLKLKIIWALLVWVWYLTILVLKHVLSYRTQKTARMSLIGFGLLALSWFGFAFAHAGGGS